VELAGAIMEIAGHTLPEDYKHIDTRTTRVILFEGGDRLLSAFPPSLSARAKADLEKLGVEVIIKILLNNITEEGVWIGDDRTPIRNVFWAAGVKASPLGHTLGVPLDRAGRVIVGPDLSVPGHPEVLVAGDMAAATSSDTGKPVPGVAQGGIQMGDYAGRTIAGETTARGSAADERARQRSPFSYHDKGTMAVIGKAKAVAQIGRFEFGGFVAWALWGGIHIAFLIGFRHRVQVLISWFWNWLLNARDARLITGPAELQIEVPRPPEFIASERSSSSPSAAPSQVDAERP
jgi:NADH dehydrogenase